MLKKDIENFENLFHASVFGSILPVPQHIEILIKISNFLIKYGSFCKCMKHFESQCTLN